MTTELQTLISDDEGLSDAERSFMRTGEVPEGFAPPGSTTVEPVKNDQVVVLPGVESTEKAVTTDQPVITPLADDPDGELHILDNHGKPHGKNGRYVPHVALFAEREEHKKTKGELATMREQFKVGDARLRQLFQVAGVDLETGQAVAPTQVNPLQEKNFEFTEDPIKAWDQMQRRQAFLMSQLSERDKKIDGVNQRIEDQNGASAALEWAKADLKQFANKQPAFGMAWEHVVGALKTQLEIAGTEPDKIDGEVNKRQVEFFRAAHRDGKSVADMIWKLAGTYGFKAPEIIIGTDGKPTIKQKGPAPGTQEAADQLKSVKNGQQASATLSGAGGANAGLTVAQIVSMSEDDYARLRAKVGKEGLRQVLGA